MKSINCSLFPVFHKGSVKRILLLTFAFFFLDTSGWVAISLVSNSFRETITFVDLSASPLFVLVSAIVSLVFVMIGPRTRSLRSHPLSFYLAALFMLGGFVLLWIQGYETVKVICFCVYAAGNAVYLFFLLELLTKASSLEAAMVIVLSSLFSVIPSVFPWLISQGMITFLLTTVLSILCIKYLDDTLPEKDPPQDNRTIGINKQMLIGTIVGLCFAGMIAGITQSISLAENRSDELYPWISGIIEAILLALLVLPSNDTNLSSGIKIISSLVIAALILLLFSSAYSYLAYLLASVSYGLIVSLGNYVSVLIVKTRSFPPMRVFGIMGVMLYSSSAVLMLFLITEIDIASRGLIAIFALSYALVALWLLSDRGIDLLITPTIADETVKTPFLDDFSSKAHRLSDEVGLTSREADVFYLVASGRSVPFIAEKLILSENTVKSYLQKVYAKCNVHSRQELISLIEDTST